jgi:hypothetical protein
VHVFKTHSIRSEEAKLSLLIENSYKKTQYFIVKNLSCEKEFTWRKFKLKITKEAKQNALTKSLEYSKRENQSTDE